MMSSISVIFCKMSRLSGLNLHRRKNSIALGQNHQCVLLSLPCKCELILVPLFYRDGKECICRSMATWHTPQAVLICSRKKYHFWNPLSIQNICFVVSINTLGFLLILSLRTFYSINYLHSSLYVKALSYHSKRLDPYNCASRRKALTLSLYYFGIYQTHSYQRCQVFNISYVSLGLQRKTTNKLNNNIGAILPAHFLLL